MKPRRISGVLFDLDGTLTRPGALDFPGIKREIHCPPDTPILEYLETLRGESKSRFLSVLERREEEAAEASLPNDGAESCLLALRERSIPFGVLTRNSMKAARIAIGKFQGIGPDDFAALVTREQSAPKPHPDGVFLAAGRMGVPVSELMVVGDFRFDIMAGKAARCCSVLLRNRGEAQMSPGDPEPDHTVDRLPEILKLIP